MTLSLNTLPEHPLAPYIRLLGKGRKGSRNLTGEEACEAMSLFLSGNFEDVQLGAFLMLLRYKEETAEEMAGFTRAVRDHIQTPTLTIDLDWPCYAGKRRRLPWFLLAAKALAHSGFRILLHGGGPHTAGRIYVEQLLEPLGIPNCQNWQSVGTALASHNIAFNALNNWCPLLQRMIDLRTSLGLRSPAHSLARLINPLGATCSLQSIFHPNYQQVHCDAAGLLGDCVIVIKGDGGEAELRPEANMRLLGTRDGQRWEETWPAALPDTRRPIEETLQMQHLLDQWSAAMQDPIGEAAILGTMAIALRGLGRTPEQAQQQATDIWKQRLD